MKKKVLKAEFIPEFETSINEMPEDSKIFVDKSLEIANYIFRLMELKGLKQKDLAEKMGKTEAEVSKWLAGMHNYTLRSIAKIEAALGSTVICTPVKVYKSNLLYYRIKTENSNMQQTNVLSSLRKLNYTTEAPVIEMYNNGLTADMS